MKAVLIALIAFGFLGAAFSESCVAEVENVMESIFGIIDENGDGTLSVHDRHRQIQAFDDNEDGVISRTEFDVGLEAHASLLVPIKDGLFAELGGANDALSVQTLIDYLKQADTNGDDVVEYAEGYDFWKEVYTRLYREAGVTYNGCTW